MLFQKLRPFAFAFLLLLMCGTLALAQPNNPPFNDTEAGAAGAGAGFFGLVCVCSVWLLALAVAVIGLASLWVIFTKAGKPGWASIVPIYNLFVLTEIAEKPLLFFILCLVPCVNIVMLFIINIEVAKKFGKDPLYGVGMALLPFSRRYQE